MNIFKDPIYIINLKHRVDRKEFVIKQLEEFDITNYEFFNAVNTFGNDALKSGELGCLLSHLELIKLAKEKKLPYITILEDDALFIPNFKNIYKKAIKEVPDNFDLFYIGSIQAIQPTMKKLIGVCNFSLTTVGYVINSTIYDKVIELLSRQSDTVDFIYARCIQPNKKSYCAYPSLLEQKSGYSDILEKDVDYSLYYNKELNQMIQ